MAPDGIAGTNGAPVPVLEWGPCAAATPEDEQALADYECSVAEVPLSYRDPNGPERFPRPPMPLGGG
jgi:hypothetical protein